jgi:hypothetical protein
MDRTTPPKEDKVDTSSVEVPTTQALVAQPESKAPHDNLGDDDPDLLNFAAVASEIACRTSSGYRGTGLTQGNRIARYGILDGPIFVTPDASPAFFVLGHEDVEGGLWAALLLAPSFFWNSPSFELSGLIILGGRSSPMTTSFPLVVLI